MLFSFFREGLRLWDPKSKFILLHTNASPRLKKAPNFLRAFRQFKTSNMSDGSKGQLQTRYTKIRNLGSGSFGDVWLVRSNYSFRNYVVKEMNKQCNDEKERAMAVNEANILAQLKHKNIVRYKDAFFDCNRFCIVMEYADDGKSAFISCFQ